MNEEALRMVDAVVKVSLAAVLWALVIYLYKAIKD